MVGMVGGGWLAEFDESSGKEMFQMMFFSILILKRVFLSRNFRQDFDFYFFIFLSLVKTFAWNFLGRLWFEANC